MDIDRRSFARSILALACAVGLFAGPTLAQQRPCQEDMKKLCPEAQPGTPEARKCLAGNMDKLSEACRQRLSAARNRRQGYPARFKGCEADLEKHCKGLMPGGGRLMRCLRSHESEISTECKSRLPAVRTGGTPKADAAGGQISSAPTAVATAQPTAPAK